MPHRFCALAECMRLLLAAMEIQVAKYVTGDMTTVAEVWVLLQLHEVIRAAVCTRTKALDGTEMPGISGLLRQLPPTWERWLTAAIIAEMSGDTRHRKTSMPPVVQAILREPGTPAPMPGRRSRSRRLGYRR